VTKVRVYNRRWCHTAIGMINPLECEHQLTQTAQAAWFCLVLDGRGRRHDRLHAPRIDVVDEPADDKRWGDHGVAA